MFIVFAIKISSAPEERDVIMSLLPERERIKDSNL